MKWSGARRRWTRRRRRRGQRAGRGKGGKKRPIASSTTNVATAAMAAMATRRADAQVEHPQPSRRAAGCPLEGDFFVRLVLPTDRRVPPHPPARTHPKMTKVATSTRRPNSRCSCARVAVAVRRGAPRVIKKNNIVGMLPSPTLLVAAQIGLTLYGDYGLVDAVLNSKEEGKLGAWASTTGSRGDHGVDGATRSSSNPTKCSTS